MSLELRRSYTAPSIGSPVYAWEGWPGVRHTVTPMRQRDTSRPARLRVSTRLTDHASMLLPYPAVLALQRALRRDRLRSQYEVTGRQVVTPSRHTYET